MRTGIAFTVRHRRDHAANRQVQDLRVALAGAVVWQDAAFAHFADRSPATDGAD